MNYQEKAEFETLKEVVKSQRQQLAILNKAAHERNLQLDAMHTVWCDGGCLRGVHRFENHEPITEEIVVEVERQARRLRKWFNSANFMINRDPSGTVELQKKVA